MFCAQCGTECRAEASFCEKCGAVVGASAPPAQPTASSLVAPQVPAAPVAQTAAGWQATAAPMVQTAAGWQAMQPGPAGWMMPVSAFPTYRLFDSGAVGLATFFGSPLAGALLMGMNYSRLGKAGKGVFAVILGALVTGGMIAIGWNSTGASGAVALVAVIATWQLAKAAQGNDVKAHVASGGQLASKWAAFGISIGTLAGIFAAAFLVIYGIQNRNSVTIGTKDQVFYSGTATKADATALGNALKSAGFFQDRGVTVLLDKGASGTTISFATEDGAWNRPGILSSFETIAWQAAPSVGGLPVQVHLVNKNKDVEKTSAVGEADFDGGDKVIYMGTATQANAQTLGQQFKEIDFFQGRGADVFVTKHDDGTTLAFVVGNDAWDDASMVSDFETIARGVAASIGGLPIHLQLDDNLLAVKKDELLQ